jgi:hypothetical protein
VDHRRGHRDARRARAARRARRPARPGVPHRTARGRHGHDEPRGGRDPRRGGRARGVGVLGPLLSRALCVAETDGQATAAEALFTHPEEDVAVVVDTHRHPVRLEHRARRREDELTTPPLCTGPRTTPAELARRVVARPGGRRFDPIVCCDERGRVVGLLRVERLLSALADATDRPPG